MRIGTIQWNGSTRSGVIREDGGTRWIELFAESTDLRTLIGRGGLSTLPREEAVAIPEGMLLPPIPHPGKLLCLAGNYAAHLEEGGHERPHETDIITPQVFLKPDTTLSADGAAIPITATNVAVGWEAELGVVIGRRCRRSRTEDALQHVFGYTVINDVSERRLNRNVAGRRVRENDKFFDWLAGKWFDGFAPCGPWIVTADEIADPQQLDIRLWVNGELRQEGTTADMLFRIPETIAYISSILTLEPGDLIATGTPAGAGLGSGSSVLRDGDEVVCEVSGVGLLRNRVRAR